MPLTVVVGAQWGDEGKGKVVDLLAERADVVARYQGGNNAGHTLVIGDETYKLRLVPSGILYPDTLCLLGNGCVIDPEVLIEELDGLIARGIDVGGLRISGNAHLIMPWHRIIDADSELALGRLQIGTTRRGIGPAYADKALRVGIRVQDLLDEKILRLKIQTALSVKNELLRKLHHHRPLDKEELTVAMLGYAERICPFISDTSLDLDRALSAGRSVVAEGAQATLLDIDHGTYPFVTSSNPIAGGACTGLGVGPTRIDRVLGVTKAYLTRVGAGPFPERGRRGGRRGDPRARRRVRHRDRPRPQVRMARPGRASLRRARQRPDRARRDQARRPLDARLDPGLHRLPPLRRHRDDRLPLPPDRLPPRDAGLQGARRLGQRHLGGDHLRRACRPPRSAYLELVETEVGVPIAIVGIGARRDQTIVVREVLRAA